MKQQILQRGLTIFKNSVKWKAFSYPKHEGSAENICTSVIKKCWNKKKGYFQTSNGHFSEFWIRDFSWVILSLIRLGYLPQVRQTLRYALRCYRKQGKITTTISASGNCYDVPAEGIDSIPSLIRCIKIAGMDKEIGRYQNFLNKEIKRYYIQFIAKKSGLVTPNIPFAEIKDHYKRKSSCYANCMAGMLRNDLEEIDLKNPLYKYNYARIIKKHFWNGRYFYDDLSKKKFISGDANTFPFWTGIIKDPKMKKIALATIKKSKLHTPLPLKYTFKKVGGERFFLCKYAPNYEGTTIWTHLGGLFLQTFFDTDEEIVLSSIRKWRKVILKYKTLPEVLEPNGVRLYKSLFYHADHGMIWAAMFLDIMKNKRDFI